MPGCIIVNSGFISHYASPIARLLAILFLLWSVESSAQRSQCDPQLTPTPDSVGYVIRNGRCEGMYVSPVSVRGGLELISLTKGRLRYDLAAGQPIGLRPANRGLGQTAINVRAMAIPLRTYYRMDTRLSAGQSWQWPVDDVLLPLRLTSDRLGIFSWTESSSGKVFVPLAVNHPAREEIHLLVRPATSVQNVMWRVSTRQAGLRHSSGWQNVVTQALAGEVIPIVLPKGDSALMDVEVAALVADGSWAKLRIKVWRE